MRIRCFIYISVLCGFMFSGSIEAITKNDIPIIQCTANRNDKRKCQVSLCSMIRDEGDYLREWIEYHLVVGVSHFYLYNNCSRDNYWEVLQPYVKKGIVELFDVPFESNNYNDNGNTHFFVQACCYNHAIQCARGSSKWLAIIDSDEFICPVIDSSVPEALKRYDYAGGVAVYWQLYGTSNVWDLKPGELLIEKLLMKAPNNTGVMQFKSIVKPQFAECVDPHWTKITGAKMVLPNHQPFSHTPGLSSLPVDIIRINHYTYRTESFYEKVKRPRRKRWGDNPSDEQARSNIDYCNSTYDPVMLRFVPALKKRMFGENQKK